MRRCFHPVGAVSKQHLVGVERQNLALRVPLLNLHGDDRFLDFSLEADIADAKADGFGEEIAGKLLRKCAGAGRPAGAVRELRFDAVEQVARKPQHDGRNAQTNVCVKACIFGGDERLTEKWGDVIVANHQTSLDGEVANQFAARGVNARDGVGVVAVEG